METAMFQYFNGNPGAGAINRHVMGFVIGMEQLFFYGQVMETSLSNGSFISKTAEKAIRCFIYGGADAHMVNTNNHYPPPLALLHSSFPLTFDKGYHTLDGRKRALLKIFIGKFNFIIFLDIID